MSLLTGAGRWRPGGLGSRPRIPGVRAQAPLTGGGGGDDDDEGEGGMATAEPAEARGRGGGGARVLREVCVS